MKTFRGFPPPITAARETTPWVSTEKRDAVRKYLTGSGIATVLNYPKALPFYPAFAYLGYLADCIRNFFARTGVEVRELAARISHEWTRMNCEARGRFRRTDSVIAMVATKVGPNLSQFRWL